MMVKNGDPFLVSRAADERNWLLTAEYVFFYQPRISKQKGSCKILHVVIDVAEMCCPESALGPFLDQKSPPLKKTRNFS